jgi:hypothetical protein
MNARLTYLRAMTYALIIPFVSFRLTQIKAVSVALVFPFVTIGVVMFVYMMTYPALNHFLDLDWGALGHTRTDHLIVLVAYIVMAVISYLIALPKVRQYEEKKIEQAVALAVETLREVRSGRILFEEEEAE